MPRAFGLFVLAFGAFLFVSIIAMGAGASPMLAVGFGYLAMIGAMRLSARGGFASLAVVPVAPRVLAASVLLGSSFLVFNLLIQSLLPFHFDDSSLEQALAAPSTWLVLVVIGLIGPFAEELVFRGNLLPAFLRRGKWFAILATSLVFALYHLSLPQLFPAFVSGVALGMLATKTRSIVPTTLAHVANNTMVIVLGQTGVAEAHPAVLVPAAVVLFAIGLALLLAHPRRELAARDQLA